jgi:hypothetical protein
MRKPSPAMIVALLGVFLGLGGVGMAATGGNFILGQSNNAGAKTALTAGVSDRALAITNLNTSSSATALGLNVAATRPPLIVNSSTKVASLNADKVDGKDSTAFLPSSGDIVLWYSPYDYLSLYLPDMLTIGRTDGPKVIVSSSSTGTHSVILPLDQPQSILGRTLKLKSVTVCFQSEGGAPITSTELYYGANGEANIAYSDAYTHSSPEKTCYDVNPTTPTVMSGSAYLRLHIYFASDSISLYSVREILGT